MNRCPISYELCGKSLYSLQGLKMLSPRLERLEILPYTAEEQRAEAMARAGEISVQGVQPKLSAILSVKESRFELADSGGRYILKPQHHIFPQLPENEDVTMRMAAAAGIIVPLHGLVWSGDKTLTYFIKRFDRKGQKEKLPVEDFAQLAKLNRDTKYNYTMEKLVLLLDEFCTFPVIEKAKLFRRVIFNFLVGNEDMHLKNYSAIRQANKIELSPAYDFLNSSIVLKGDIEEIALPLAGKKKRLSRKILVEYFGRERCKLTEKVIESNLSALANAREQWFSLLNDSFLSDEMKDKYMKLLEKRLKILDL